MFKFIKDRLRISWYEKGQWAIYPLTKQGDSIYHANTGDACQIHVCIDPLHSPAADHCLRVEVKIVAKQCRTVSGVKLEMPLEASYECAWKPHLAPMDDYTIGDKAFRSPAMILENESHLAALVPDLHHLQHHRLIPHIMDYIRDEQVIYYGLSDYEETGHVYYKMNPKPHRLDDPLVFRFFLAWWDKEPYEEKRSFQRVERFLWERFAGGNMKLNEHPDQIVQSLRHYETYAYEWALNRWEDVCWQQFKIGETEVGGVVFIVRAAQKPGRGQEENWRENKSIWNQAWFCSLRSAYGYALSGMLYGRPDWTDKAKRALEFALSAPQINGLFPGYYAADKHNNWAGGRWYMSCPRRPPGHEEYVHLLDSSWTCCWLLKWYRDIGKDERILPYVRNYVKTLISLQKKDGSFPAWVKPDTLEVSPYLTESPETSMHVMLLCMLQEIDPRHNYIPVAEKAVQFVMDRIVPQGRWEDFETYWSCSGQWEGKRYGQKDARSGLYNQCNFGMYWTAEALKWLYQLTGEDQRLKDGERVLAEMSLYQQIWEPPFFQLPTLGGFGVMTSDDEWNDARQSLFALTYYDYYVLTKNETYLTRAMWAMKASFYMMYCPENPAVKALYEAVHPHLNEKDYGFHMENFNHHDGTSVNGLGEFTIFDWGCGAAATSLVELTNKMKANT